MFKRLADAGRDRLAERSTARISARVRATPSRGAMLAAGVDHCRTTPVTGAPRAPYCLMGVCFDCLVTIDGVGNRQACLVPVREGMADRDPARQARGRAMNAAPDLATSYDARRRSAAARPASPRRRSPPRPACRRVLFDENPGVGGQIYRGITSTPVADRAILGEDYWAGADAGGRGQGERRRDRQRRHGVEPRSATAMVGVSIAGQARMIQAKRVIIATGSLERPFPIPGWTLPGVMTAGAAQTALKAQGLVPTGRTVMAGCGPLLWLLAAQILRAGAQDRGDPRHHAARQLAAARCCTCRTSCCRPTVARAWRCCARSRRKVPVIAGVTGSRRTARTSSPRSCSRPARGERRMTADLLLLHQGVVPNVNLAMAAGVAHRWNDRQLCFEPVVDADFGNSRCAASPSRATAPASPAARRRPSAAASRRIAAVEALKPGAAVTERADGPPVAGARGDGPRLPRRALSAGAVVPPARSATPSSAAARR